MQLQLEWVTFKGLAIPNVDQDEMNKNFLIIDDRNVKLHKHFGKQLIVFLLNKYFSHSILRYSLKRKYAFIK